MAAAARSRVASQETAGVPDAPRLPTSGPIAVPSGFETMTTTLRAASTNGRFTAAVEDWKRA
jgi:hypothetical protein